MKIHGSKSILKQKRIWLAVGVALCIIGVIIVWIAAAVHQKDINKQVDIEYSNTIETARAVSADSKMSQDKRLDAVEQLSSAKPTNSCDGDWWSAWYQALPAAKKTTLECNSKVQRLNVVYEAAGELDIYLDDDSKVAQNLALLKVSTSSETWQKTAQTSADAVLRALERISTNKNNEALLTTSKDKTKIIIDAWKVFSEASLKEDKTAYLEAQNSLSQAYANLGEVSDASDKQVIELVHDLQASIDKL